MKRWPKSLLMKNRAGLNSMEEGFKIFQAQKVGKSWRKQTYKWILTYRMVGVGRDLTKTI